MFIYAINFRNSLAGEWFFSSFRGVKTTGKFAG
jgi:hypothetical protein